MLLIKTNLKRLFSSLALGLLVAGSPVAIANAVCNPNAQSCSSGYQVTESFFGNGGGYACSGNQYCANQSAGELTNGNTSGNDYQAQAGFNSNRTPYIELTINTSDVDVGILDQAQTHVGSASFSIKTYLAQGYQIATAALPPKTPAHTLDALSLSAPTPGTERFGINLVANTCPGSAPGSGDGSCTSTLGANPVCNPTGFCNVGTDVTIGTNYSTPNQYYYPASGSDTLLTSTSSTGTTDYTISYIFNISNVTPPGVYHMAHDIVATSTF